MRREQCEPPRTAGGKKKKGRKKNQQCTKIQRGPTKFKQLGGAARPLAGRKSQFSSRKKKKKNKKKEGGKKRAEKCRHVDEDLEEKEDKGKKTK